MHRFASKTLGCAAACLALGVSNLQGQPQETILHAITLGKTKTPVRSTRTASWPAVGRQIPLRLSEREGEWDGMPMSYAKFEGGNLALELRFSDLEYWTRVEPTLGRYSLEFAFQWNPNVILGVAAIPRRRPFEDLSEATWQAYVASLASLPACAIHVDDDSQQNNQMLQILGGRTRVIATTTTDPKTAANRRVIQVWVELKDSLLVLSLEGADEAVTQAQTAFASVVRSFSFPE